MYTHHDSISIFDFNGNPKCNIYGSDFLRGEQYLAFHGGLFTMIN